MQPSTTTEPEPTTEEAAPQRRTRQFRNKFTTPRLDPASAARQGKIAQIAWAALGKDAALVFLNGHDDTLDARPLDVAIASDAGLKTVEQMLAMRGVKAR